MWRISRITESDIQISHNRRRRSQRPDASWQSVVVVALSGPLTGPPASEAIRRDPGHCRPRPAGTVAAGRLSAGSTSRRPAAASKPPCLRPDRAHLPPAATVTCQPAEDSQTRGGAGSVSRRSVVRVPLTSSRRLPRRAARCGVLCSWSCVLPASCAAASQRAAAAKCDLPCALALDLEACAPVPPWPVSV